MHRRFPLLVVFVAVLGLAASPTSAITNGAPDGNRHPNVGTMLMYFGDIDQTFPWCSGSLVAESTFLTAAHCAPQWLPPEWQASVVGVSFDTAFDPDTSEVVLADAMIVHPDYVDADWPDTPDIAVIQLAQPAAVHFPLIEPVDLPAAGLLAEIVGKPRFRQAALTLVGYGTVGVTHGGGPPQQVYPDVRKYASAWLRQGPRPWELDGDYVFHTTHPGGKDGNGGGTCNGDSGGPVFLGDSRSNLQIGVTSGGWHVGYDQVLCRTAKTFAFRLDTPTARNFLCGQAVAAACDGPAAAERKVAKADDANRDRRAKSNKHRRR